MSERRACRVSVSIVPQRKIAKIPDDEAALTADIPAFALTFQTDHLMGAGQGHGRRPFISRGR